MNDFMKLRFHTGASAPHGAGPTRQRDDVQTRRLARRVKDWESNKDKSAHEQHKPGSLKSKAAKGLR